MISDICYASDIKLLSEAIKSPVVSLSCNASCFKPEP